MNNITITLLGYIGPETMLPLASFFAAALGIILMFWKFIFRLIRRMFTAIFRLFFRKKKNIDIKTSVPNNSEVKEVITSDSVLVKDSEQEAGGEAKE